MSRVSAQFLILLGLVSVSGCPSFETADLRAFAPTQLTVQLPGPFPFDPTQVTVVLGRDGSRDDCRMLGDVEGTINGIPLQLIDRGRPVPVVKGNGFSCPSASFVAPAASLAAETDGLSRIEFNQDGFVIAAAFKNLAMQRELRPPASLQVARGGALSFDWSPASDQIDPPGAATLTSSDGTRYSVPVSHEKGRIDVSVTSEVPAGRVRLDLLVGGEANVAECEGLALCHASVFNRYEGDIEIFDDAGGR